MSDAQFTGIVTILAAIIVTTPPTILAYATLRKTREVEADVVALKTDVVKKVTVVEDKTNQIIGQNTEIKTMGDGNTSRLMSEITTQAARIEGLERLVSSLTPRGGDRERREA